MQYFDMGEDGTCREVEAPCANPDLVVINKRKLSMLLTQAIQNAESDEIELAITQLARSINDLMRGDDGD